MTHDPVVWSKAGSETRSPVTWPIRPSIARITTPAPLDLFVSFRKRQPSALNWIKAARATAVWRARPGLRGLGIYLRLVGWIVRFLPEAASQLWKHGTLWRETFGRGYLEQIGDLVAVASHNALPPRDYYRCDMARLRRAGTFFEMFSYQLYATPLLVLSNPADVSVANDKLRLSALLKPAGIDAPSILAVVKDGAARDLSGATATLPKHDFLVKPAAGMQGGDVAIWRYGPDGCWSNASVNLDEAALGSRLIRNAATMRGGALVQEVLVNHASLAAIAPYALSSFRIVTVLDEHRRPEVVIGQFRTATDPASAVDNYHAGGCLFAIDLEKGQFGVGHQRDFAERPQAITRHPVTGASIAGQPVPGLDGACEAALNAHALFPEIVCIGWDVAYTTRGHVILEANVPPGLQPSQQIVLGDRARRRFVELIGFHARQWLEASEPPGSCFLVGRDL